MFSCSPCSFTCLDFSCTPLTPSLSTLLFSSLIQNQVQVNHLNLQATTVDEQSINILGKWLTKSYNQCQILKLNQTNMHDQGQEQNATKQKSIDIPIKYVVQQFQYAKFFFS